MNVITDFIFFSLLKWVDISQYIEVVTTKKIQRGREGNQENNGRGHAMVRPSVLQCPYC